MILVFSLSKSDLATIKKIGISAVIIIVGMILLNSFGGLLAGDLPNYSDPGNPRQWQNTLTDSNGTVWTYRREITVENPTTENQSGTYGFVMKFYKPWIGDKKVFKVDYGIVKVVRAFPNPEPDSADLLREVPALTIGYDQQRLMVYFDYSVEANSTARYYVYSKQSKTPDISYQINTPIGIASLGGFTNNVSVMGFTNVQDIEVWNNDYYYYGEFAVDRLNRWPQFYRYKIGGYQTEYTQYPGGLYTTEMFNLTNTYIRMTGSRYILDAHGGTFFIGLSDGLTENVGVTLYMDEEDDKLEEQVSDLVFNYGNGTASQKWINPYKVPKDGGLLSGSKYREVDFVYEFIIDADQNCEFVLSVDGWDHEVLKRENLGQIQFSEANFKLWSNNHDFVVNSIIISENDVFRSDQNNGVHISVGSEVDLRYAQNIMVENSYTVIIGLVTLVVVLVYFLLPFIPGRRYLMMLFMLLMLILILSWIGKYHPIRLVLGIEDGYYYIGESELGVEVMEGARVVHPFFYFFMYFCLPLSLLLSVFSIKAKTDKFSIRNLGKFNPKILAWIPAIGTIILTIMFFVPSTFVDAAFWIMAIGSFVLLFDTFKDGYSEGKKSHETKFLSRFYAKATFIYFVLNIVVQAYKTLVAGDPFNALDPELSPGNADLGALVPILANFGIPLSIINILAIIFSNWATIIVLGFTFLKEAFGSDGGWSSKLNGGLWVVYLWFAAELIRFPFFLLIVSMIYVVAWLNSYMFSKSIAKNLGYVVHEEETVEKKKGEKQ
jgi:hypothetical protein